MTKHLKWTSVKANRHFYGSGSLCSLVANFFSVFKTTPFWRLSTLCLCLTGRSCIPWPTRRLMPRGILAYFFDQRGNGFQNTAVWWIGLQATWWMVSRFYPLPNFPTALTPKKQDATWRHLSSVIVWMTWGKAILPWQGTSSLYW